MKPKVTIGMCGRNCADLVAFALESVVKQDFPHDLMEIIFVDDGSEDNTLNAVKDRFSRMDIAARIFSDKWRGLGKARNTVINNAYGDFIIWLDSDEILEKAFVRKQISLIESNPKAGIATAMLGVMPTWNIILTLDLIPSAVEYSSQDWTRLAKLPGTGGATYRVIAARQVGGFDGNMSTGGEDIDIANRIRQKGWSIIRGEAKFYEKHGNLSTWRDLWKRYATQGIYSRHLYKKSDTFFSLYRMNPFASFVAGLLYVNRGYKLTKLKIVFLLPFHFFFKMTAWFYGFTKNRMVTGEYCQ